MAEKDPALDARDVAAATGFLTRLPIPVNGAWATARGARSAWAYPIAGLLIGALAAGAGFAAQAAGVPAAMAAGLALALSILVTGALHEDGLADTCDGFWGGWVPARRLEIMKDSRIGTYGVLGLGITLLLRWQGYAVLIAAGWGWGIVAAAAASRAAMVPLMRLPHARADGVSVAVGRPPAGVALAAVALGALTLLPFGGAGVLAMLAVAGAAWGLGALARAKIGGQTGDILGATQQVSEITILLILAGATATTMTTG